MFNLSKIMGTEFLQFVKKQIDMKEFSLLANEAGFLDPNTFTVEKVMRPLINGEFPQYEHYEYLWAIYECDLKRLSNYSRWMKMYISALYIYCNKVKLWGISIESDFYYLVIESELDCKDFEGAKQFLMFIEWLYEYVEADDGYDDYYCLLAWIFIRRFINCCGDKTFQVVINTLIDKNYSKSILSELTVSEGGSESWFDLHKRIPMGGNISSIDWRRIILGTDLAEINRVNP